MTKAQLIAVNIRSLELALDFFKTKDDYQLNAGKVVSVAEQFKEYILNHTESKDKQQ